MICGFIYINNCNNSNLTREKIFIFDVRTHDEVVKYPSNVHCALNHEIHTMEDNEIIEILEKYNISQMDTIYVFCRTGRRSNLAKEKLNKLNYNNIINAGGYQNVEHLNKYC